MNKTYVTFRSDKNHSIYKWVRNNLGLGIKESKELVDCGIIDFNGDCNQALEFYNYLIRCNETIISLEIKIEETYHPHMGVVGGDCVSLKYMDDDKIFNDELLSFDIAKETAISKSHKYVDVSHSTEQLAYRHGFIDCYSILESPKAKKQLVVDETIEQQFPAWGEVNEHVEDKKNKLFSMSSNVGNLDSEYEVYRYLKHWYYRELSKKQLDDNFWENLSYKFYNDKVAHDYKDGKFDYRAIHEWFMQQRNKNNI